MALHESAPFQLPNVNLMNLASAEQFPATIVGACFLGYEIGGNKLLQDFIKSSG